MQKQPFLTTSIQYIIEGLKVEPNRNIWALVRLMEQANVKPEDILSWADFAHPPSESYGRKLVYEGEGFELMVMSWLPGDFSAIHDHGYTQWGAVQIFGPAEHATFKVFGDHLETTARWQVQAGTILPVQHDLIHQMGNPSAHPFLSLHIYGLELEVASITGDARIFDPVQGKIQRVHGGVFFALKEQQIKAYEPGFVGDYPTRLRFQVEDVCRRLSMPKYQEGIQADALEIAMHEIFDEPFFLAWKRLKNGELAASSILAQEVKAAERLWEYLHRNVPSYANAWGC